MLMKPSFRVLALLLLLLASSSFAGWIEFCSQDVLYCSIFPITALIVTLILVFIYMLSQAISNPQLEAWTKLEIRELLSGVILAIIVIILLTSTDFGLKFLTNGEDMVKTGSKFLDVQSDNLAESYESTIKASHYLTALSGYSYTYPSIPFYYGAYTYSSALYPGASVFLSSVSQTAQALSNAMFAYSALKAMLLFFTSLAFVVPLASLGLTFRILPFTRQLGNTLIGLAIGAMIILPFSVLVMREFHNSIINSSPPIEAIPKISSFASMEVNIPVEMLFLCNAGIDFFGFEIGFRSFLSLGEIGWGLIIAPMCYIAFAACFTLITETYYPIISMIVQLFFGLRILMEVGASSVDAGTILGVLQPYFEAVNKIVVLSYIDTLVVAIITVVGTKSVITAIGGEYYLVGLQRLI